MQSISTAERKFLVEGVELNVRSDGRGRQDYRTFTVETGVALQANGSARIKLDHTHVLVAVRLDLGPPALDSPDQGMCVMFFFCGGGGDLH